MRRALVTGGTGFVGSAVARRLLREGVAVRVLARKGGDRRALRGLDVEIAEGDLLDPATLLPAARGCDALFHVAADYRLWVPDPDALYRTNVDGSANVVLAAAEAGVARMVYTSSVAVLGHADDGGPADETTPSSLGTMIGHYKRSKFLAEEKIRDLHRRHDLDLVIVNPSAPVGPFDVKPTPTGRMIRDAAAGKMPAYLDTGLNIVHVDDVAAGHVLAHARGRAGERYILGGENLTLREIVTTLARMAGRRPPLMRLPYGAVMPIAFVSETAARFLPIGEPRVTMDAVRMAKKKMFFSSAKAGTELGYIPRPASDAFRDAIAWFRANGYMR